MGRLAVSPTTHIVTLVLLLSFRFFFSSRRRHTRCSRDWSSDVCSSDLRGLLAAAPEGNVQGVVQGFAQWSRARQALLRGVAGAKTPWSPDLTNQVYSKIGRASCRERV